MTIQAVVGKVMSLLFNVLCRFVIAFLPRRKRLLILWLQSLSTAILEPKKIKSVSSWTVPVEGVGGHVAQHSIIPYSLIIAYAVNRGCVLLPTAISPIRCFLSYG